MVQRSRFVTRLAHQFGSADAVVFGDSLTEETDFADACGRTFVAGIGGARTAHLSAIAPEILDATQPKTIILAVGTNYFIVRDEINNMRAEYPPFAQSLARRGRLILVGVGNSREGDALVRKVAAELHSDYVHPITDKTLIVADGIHHIPAGSRVYRDRVAKACRGMGFGQTRT